MCWVRANSGLLLRLTEALVSPHQYQLELYECIYLLILPKILKDEQEMENG